MPPPMTRTPTQLSTGDAAFAAASGAPRKVFESQTQRSTSEGTSRGYREKNTAASKAPLPLRTAATCRSFRVFFCSRRVDAL